MDGKLVALYSVKIKVKLLDTVLNIDVLILQHFPMSYLENLIEHKFYDAVRKIKEINKVNTIRLFGSVFPVCLFGFFLLALLAF